MYTLLLPCQNFDCFPVLMLGCSMLTGDLGVGDGAAAVAGGSEAVGEAEAEAEVWRLHHMQQVMSLIVSDHQQLVEIAQKFRLH